MAQNGPAAKQIHMLGPHKDAVYYLPGKDVCICPSTRDASPRSLREAMACKVACIVTDIPGPGFGRRRADRYHRTGRISASDCRRDPGFGC